MIDIDASWDGKGSLDDHRTKVMETLEQPGFGSGAKPVAPVPEPVDDDDTQIEEAGNGE